MCCMLIVVNQCDLLATQSAYRRHHSTESAVLNDIVRAVDRTTLVPLVLLDLTDQQQPEW